MTSLSSGEPGGNYVLKPGRANRLDPIALAELVFLMLSLRRLWYMGIIHAGTNTVMNWTFYAKSGIMHRTCPSIIRVYGSDRSNDAVTLTQI